MTRRFFAQLFVGFTLALPINFNSKSHKAAPTTFVREECGPVSPLRKTWPEMDMDKFRLDVMI
jgi:hypothetical protein